MPLFFELLKFSEHKTSHTHSYLMSNIFLWLVLICSIVFNRYNLEKSQDYDCPDILTLHI